MPMSRCTQAYFGFLVQNFSKANGSKRAIWIPTQCLNKIPCYYFPMQPSLCLQQNLFRVPRNIKYVVCA